MTSESWLSIPKGSHFSLANIPFGIITTPASPNPHAGIAIGDYVLDLYLFATHGGFSYLESFSSEQVGLFSQSTLNQFAAAGQEFHKQVRRYLQDVFSSVTTVPQALRDNQAARDGALFPKEHVKTHLPMKVTGYTDFFAGKNHAYNCGCIFRDPQKALQPNYLHLPVGYSSRASSVVVSGTPVRRPLGQYLANPGDDKSVFGPCRKLDIELELGAFLCKGNAMGEPIPIDKAEGYIFGFVLLNDWSARDIQAWEAVPLGPFNAKNFASTISPWVVLKDALEPFHVPGLLNDTELHPYLRQERQDNVYDINLQAEIKTADGKSEIFTRTNGKNLVFSFAQMLAHHTIGGCPMEVGDLIGSGTISGTEPGSLGSLLEASLGGKQTYAISTDIHRKFLEDGDTISIRGWCGKDDSNLRFVVANSFESIKQLWINNQSSLISRPTLHTFHNVLSSSQGFTIGTSPWDESCKRRRKAAATALNRPAVASYMPFVDLESYVSIKDLVDQIRSGEQQNHTEKDSKKTANFQVDIDPYPLFQRLALNLSLTLGYGFRIDGGADDHLLREIINVERGISTLRSTSNNWQDFVPLLRIFPRRNDQASNLRRRRDKYLEFLLQRLKDRISAGTDKPCITGNIMKDPDYALNHAGGLDTTPACILLGVAILSGPQGQYLQQKLLEEINKVYPDGSAWKKCLDEEKVEYLTAFCKEVLRFWTVIPMSLPRVNVKEVVYKGARIPAGTTFLMNAWAADFDYEHFESPLEFRPERFLNIPEGSGTQHFAFGAGSRMCTGSHLANREMYITFMRIIIALEVLPAQDPAQRPILTGPLECNANPSGLSIEPKKFLVGFRIRDDNKLRHWFEDTEMATRHMLD
ncbi:Phenylacetate 2-hydroxylase [Talaromyces pinophilus]|nr:Phenylacetate 2-hydroxylase [Talaromyces pinophilus]